MYAVEILSTYPDGTKSVRFITQFSDGNISKIKKSTVFPENWSESKIIDSIKTTSNTHPLTTRASDGASLYQSTIDGVKVEVIKIGNNVTAGYPCGAKCMTVEEFVGM